MPVKNHLLIVCLSDVGRDPRVRRQIEWLKPHYRLSVLGFGQWQEDGIAAFLKRDRPNYGSLGIWGLVKILTRLQVARFLPLDVYIHPIHPFPAIRTLAAEKFDAIIVNDAEPLPLAFELAQGAPVLFDAHEYYPLEAENSLTWRLFLQHYWTRLCRRYIPLCQGMTTVCQSIAEEYQRRFKTPRMEVITNAHSFADIAPSPVDGKRVRLIHHGGAMPGRALDRMMEMMDYVDSRFSLELMLTPSDPGYLAKLKRMAATRSNVKIIDPVSMPEIVGQINRYDMGVSLLPPVSFNDLHALPNKFFEFIQARLGIAVGPSVEMARIVNQEGLGVVADDFNPASLAAKLNALTSADIVRFKENAAKAAKKYNAERNGERFCELMAQVIASRR